MHLKLEDNTQEALQFLLLGAAIVLAIRVVLGGIGLWLDSGTEDVLIKAAANYRNDFLLGDGRTIVVGGMDIFGRLSLAFLVALVGGVIGSAIGALYTHAVKQIALHGAVQGARAGLILLAALGVYSALFLPPKAVQITDEGALILERPSLLGGLGMPVPAHEIRIGWDQVEKVEHRSRAAGMPGCGVHEEVVLHGQGRSYVIAMEVPSGKDCDRSIGEARSAARDLVEALSSRY